MTEVSHTEKKVTLTAHFFSATSTIRFPAYFTILWKTQDSAIQQQTTKVQVKHGLATFDQSLALQLPVPFNEDTNTFAKCQTQIHLRLISKAKEHQQPKLVGKINLQISSILNNSELQGKNMEYPLSFCSANAVLNISFQVQQIAKCEKTKVQKVSNPTPPKSPPSLAFVKPQDITNKQKSQEKKSQKISLSSIKLPLTADLEEKPKENDKKSTLAQLQESRSKQMQNFKRINQKITQQRDYLASNLAYNSQSLKICQDQLELFKNQNEKLRQQLRKKLDQNVKLHLLISEVRQENSQKTFLLAANNRDTHKMEILNSQLEKANSQKGQLKFKVKQQQRIALQLKSEKFTLQSEIKTSKNQINLLKAQLQKYLKQTTTHNQTLNQKQQQRKVRSQLEARVKSLQNQLSNSQKRALEVQSNKDQNWKHTLHLQSLYVQRQQRINELQSVLLFNQQQVKVVKERNLQLQTSLSQKVSEIIDLQRQKSQSIIQATQHGQQALQKLQKQKNNALERLYLQLSQKQQQISVCQLQNNQMNEQFKSLKQSYQSLIQQLERYKNKVSELEEILLINNEIKAKQLQQQQTRQRLSHMKVKQLQQQNKTLTHNYNRMEERVVMIESEIAEKQSLIERLKNGLSKQMSAYQAKNIELIGLEEKLQNHLSQISILQIELTTVKELINVDEENDQKLTKRIADLQLQLYELLTAYECLQGKYRELEKQQENIIAQNYSKMNHIEQSLNAESLYSESLKSELTKKIEQLQIGNKQWSETQRQNDRLRKHLQEMQHLVFKDSQQKDKMIVAISRENESIKQEASLLRQSIGMKESKLEQSMASLQKLSTKLASVEKELIKYKNQIQRLEHQIQECQGQRFCISKEFQTLKKEFQQKQKLYGTQISNLRTSCQQSQCLIKELGAKLQHQREEYNKKTTISSLQKDRLDLQRQQFLQQLQLKDAQIEQLKLLIKQLTVQNKEITQKLSTEKQKIEQQKEQQKPSNGYLHQNEVNHQEYDNEQLLRVISEKNEQILELQLEIDRLASQSNQAYDLMEQVQAYRQELELHEEQRVTFEALTTRNNIEIAQLKEQNIKLKNEISSLTEKNNELELNLYLTEQEKESKAEGQLGEQDIDYQLNIQVSNLRVRVKELQDRNGYLQAQLEDKEEKHVVDLIDQHIRLSKSDQLQSNHARSNSRISKQSLPDFLQTCQIIKEILKNRKALTLINTDRDQSSSLKPKIEDIPRYSRMVSLQLQKMKSQFLKGDKKTSISELFKNCENSIKSLCSYVQQCCSYQ